MACANTIASSTSPVVARPEDAFASRVFDGRFIGSSVTRGTQLRIPIAIVHSVLRVERIRTGAGALAFETPRRSADDAVNRARRVNHDRLRAHGDRLPIGRRYCAHVAHSHLCAGLGWRWLHNSAALDALLALAPHLAVRADAAASAFFAFAFPPPMSAYAGAPAFLTTALPPAVRAYACASAISAPAFLPAVNT